jgi:hypothetical protein
MRYNAKLSGGVYSLPPDDVSKCKFKIIGKKK